MLNDLLNTGVMGECKPMKTESVEFDFKVITQRSFSSYQLLTHRIHRSRPSAAVIGGFALSNLQNWDPNEASTINIAIYMMVRIAAIGAPHKDQLKKAPFKPNKP